MNKAGVRRWRGRKEREDKEAHSCLVVPGYGRGVGMGGGCGAAWLCSTAAVPQ